jgi:hypothetical protein
VAEADPPGNQEPDEALQDKVTRMIAAMEQFQATMDAIDPELFHRTVPDDPGPAMAPEEIDRICDGYFEYHEYLARRQIRAAPKELSDISDLVMDLRESHPERLWPLLLELIERAPTDEVRGFVAAGPLEDLVRGYPERFVDRLEAATIKSRSFHEAMRSIWGLEDLPDEVRERLMAVVTPEWEDLAERRAALG